MNFYTLALFMMFLSTEVLLGSVTSGAYVSTDIQNVFNNSVVINSESDAFLLLNIILTYYDTRPFHKPIHQDICYSQQIRDVEPSIGGAHKLL